MFTEFKDVLFDSNHILRKHTIKWQNPVSADSVGATCMAKQMTDNPQNDQFF